MLPRVQRPRVQAFLVAKWSQSPSTSHKGVVVQSYRERPAHELLWLELVLFRLLRERSDLLGDVPEPSSVRPVHDGRDQPAICDIPTEVSEDAGVMPSTTCWMVAGRPRGPFRSRPLRIKRGAKTAKRNKKFPTCLHRNADVDVVHLSDRVAGPLRVDLRHLDIFEDADDRRRWQVSETGDATGRRTE